MTDDWPRDPAALARALNERVTETLTRPMSRGGKQYPKHVPADALDLDERVRPLPEHIDAETPLCGAYNSRDQYTDPVRKDANTQMNRSRWCRTCAAIVANLGPNEFFTAPVEPDAATDGGAFTRDKDTATETECPMCGESYVGHLPVHLRRDCPENE